MLGGVSEGARWGGHLVGCVVRAPVDGGEVFLAGGVVDGLVGLGVEELLSDEGGNQCGEDDDGDQDAVLGLVDEPVGEAV